MKLKINYLFVIVGLIIISPSLFAQDDEEFDKLMILYADGQYDKCVIKGEKFASKDNYKRHPLPYLYVAMANFEMSRDQKYQEDFPKAFKDALSYASKYRKKDDELKYYVQFQDFFTDLKLVVLEEVLNYIAEGDDKSIKKAHSNLKRVVKIDPLDAGAWLMKGVLEVQKRDRTGSRESFETGSTLLNEIKSFDDLTEDQQKYLKHGLMIYADYLYNSRKVDQAKDAINIGYQFQALQEDEAYHAKYMQITK